MGEAGGDGLRANACEGDETPSVGLAFLFVAAKALRKDRGELGRDRRPSGRIEGKTGRLADRRLVLATEEAMTDAITI